MKRFKAVGKLFDNQIDQIDQIDFYLHKLSLQQVVDWPNVVWHSTAAALAWTVVVRSFLEFFIYKQFLYRTHTQSRTNRVAKWIEKVPRSGEPRSVGSVRWGAFDGAQINYSASISGENEDHGDSLEDHRRIIGESSENRRRIMRLERIECGHLSKNRRL